MTKSGNEFHSLIAEGKKENKYVLLLAASWIYFCGGTTRIRVHKQSRPQVDDVSCSVPYAYFCPYAYGPVPYAYTLRICFSCRVSSHISMTT